jgi:hypothetical protein
MNININKDYNISIRFLVDVSDDGYGYICSKSPKTLNIYVSFWAKDTKTVRTIFLSTEDMYARAKAFESSGLTTYSQNHIAQHKMYKAFIHWYEHTHQ